MLRTIARNVARNRMKKAGYVKICKGNPSYFSRHWRDFVGKGR